MNDVFIAMPIKHNDSIIIDYDNKIIKIIDNTYGENDYLKVSLISSITGFHIMYNNNNYSDKDSCNLFNLHSLIVTDFKHIKDYSYFNN